MTRSFQAALALLLAFPPPAPAEPSSLLQDAVAAYQAGRPFEALDKLGELVEREPGNAVAKNYIWTITRRIQKEDAELGLSAAQREKAAALARERLEARRRRTQEILEEMRGTLRQSAGLRSPKDILDGMVGVNRFLGQDLEGDLAQTQARGYLDRIVANLTEALRRDVFVSRKDQLRAEGYKAYLQGNPEETVRLWEACLREDPGDADVRQELDALKELREKKRREEKIDELTYRAKAHFRAGDYAQALEAWKEVLVLEPGRPGVVEQAAVARAAMEKAGLQARLKVMVNEGIALYKEGDAFGAAQKWLDVLMQDPANEEARGWLSHVGKKFRASGPAEKEAPPVSAAPAASAQVMDPAKGLELYKEGILFYAQNNLEKAVACWKAALREDPSLTRAREALRQAQMEMNLR